MGVQLMILPTYNFFPYNECHPILVFQVFSAEPDLVSLIGGGFSRPFPSDLSKAQDVPSTAFHFMNELLYFSVGMWRMDVPCSYCCPFFWQSDGGSCSSNQ